jgi:hypothetical protein
MIRLLFVVALLAAGCGDNSAAPRDPDPAVPADAGVDGAVALAPCLDRPTDLSTAPAGQLPCELLPPGFKP